MAGWSTLDGYKGLLPEEKQEFQSEDPATNSRLKGLDVAYLQAVEKGDRPLAEQIKAQARQLKFPKH